jgi:hypothetical protein
MRMFCLTVLCGAMLTALPSAARAQAPILGQPYQVPAEFSSYVAGSLINYAGFNYVIRGDGTMLPSQNSGFTYSSYYGPPAATYSLVQQPIYSPWGGYQLASSRGWYRHAWYRHAWYGPHGGFACGRHYCWR